MRDTSLADRILRTEASEIRVMRAAADSMERKGIRIFHMEQGEPDFPTPTHIVEAAVSAIRDGWTHYPPNAGLPELRDAISRKLKTQNHIDADPRKEILVTTGAAQAIFCAFAVLVRPGDEILIPTPAFPSFRRCANFFDARTVEIPLDERDGYALKASMISKSVSKKSKLLVINSPCNPTGAVATLTQLEDLAGLVERENLWVLTDELYEKILFDDSQHVSFASLDGMRDRTISVFGFSKSYSMTGWRIGYCCGPEEVVGQMNKAIQITTSCGNSFGQRAAVAALDGPQSCITNMVSEFRKRRDILLSSLHSLGIESTKPGGAFYIFPNFAKLGVTSREASRLLLERAHVSVTPGSAFGSMWDTYLRMSLTIPSTEITNAVRRIGATVDSLKSASRSMRDPASRSRCQTEN